MKSIAIIGSGIAGLGCAHRLQDDFDVTIFDRNSYTGGHSNTVEVVEDDGRGVAIDTGFMVYNEVTYPNLTRLFATLGVATKPAPMSFGVQDVARGIEYGGSSVSQLFAQRRNALNPRFLHTLFRINRFNKEALAALEDDRFARMTLQQYADARGYGEDFLRLYLLPMSSAVWSTPFDEVRKFPALTLLRFFQNHGLLGGLSGQLEWRTVEGGSKTYVEKLSRPFRERIRHGCAVERVTRDERGVSVRAAGCPEERFDRVIFACHADEALALLADPTAEEQRLLGAFHYQENMATLHMDPSPMPRSRRAWASWNYRIDMTEDSSARPSGATTIYWMNNLQGVSVKRNYFVSIDDPGLIDPRQILRSIRYHHPLFSLEAIDAQRELPSLNGIGPGQTTYFCGSYFRYGFHEDALTSGLEASAALIGHDAPRSWTPLVLQGGAPAVAQPAASAGESRPMAATSSLYECEVTHQRFSPKAHQFSYKVFVFAIEIDELDSLAARTPCLSRNRFNVFSFFDGDHLRLGHSDVRSNVLELLRREGVAEPVGRIVLITSLRIFGYVFNPVSFFFCFDEHDHPLAAVAEVNNTFGETKPFVMTRLDLRETCAKEGQSATFESRQRKEFYISPFSDLDLDLHLRLAIPAQRLGIVIDDVRGLERIVSATMTGQRRPLTTGRLAWFSIKYPLLTLRVIAAIHWQALRLWIKGVPFHRKAENPQLQRGIIESSEQMAAQQEPSHEALEAGER